MAQAVQVEYLISGIMHGGEPLASGQVYFYETDGTTAKTIWNDANKSSTASNPVTLDSNGKGEIFADGTYTVLIKTSAGSTIQTLENQYFFPNDSVAASEINASTFGSSNNTTISLAVTSAGGSDKTVWLSPGNWEISDNLTIPSNINLKFLYGAYVTVSNTKTLTIQGTVEGPNYNIFRGDGTVTYDDRTNVIPSIWGIGGSHDNLTLDGTVTIKDNLIVNGTTTTINSTVVTIDDPIFTLGGDTAPGSDDNKDRGIEFRYHTGSAAKVGFFGYDDSEQKFSFLVDATNSSEVFSGTTATIVANLEGTIQTAAQANITSVGTLNSLLVSGDATFDTSTLKVDSTNNRVGIGTTTPSSIMHLANSGGSIILTMQRTNANTTGSLGDIIFNASDNHTVAGIRALGDGDNEGAHLIFGATSTASGNGFSNISEYMRITSDGNVNIGNASTSSNGIVLYNSGVTYHYQNGTGSSNTVRFYRNVDSSAALVGSITTDGSNTAYNTSSDYRLKENIKPITDGISRLMTLKPSRFNFIADKNKILDGFIAHEVQDIIPNAITGKKDAVDEEGNPEFQGIDHSKIVPLLVASVQELKRELDLIKNG